MTESLTLPGVVQRFEESTATLDELAERLRTLSAQETSRSESTDALRDSATQLASTAEGLGAASEGVFNLTTELMQAAELARQNLDLSSPEIVMRALVHQGSRIDQVEKQLAALAGSLVTLASGLNQHFVHAEERSARSSADLDTVLDRISALPARVRKKHKLQWADEIRQRRAAGYHESASA